MISAQAIAVWSAFSAFNSLGADALWWWWKPAPKPTPHPTPHPTRAPVAPAPIPTTPTSGSGCSDAWAYGNVGASTCFKDLPSFYGSHVRGGWSIGPLTAGTYTFDIFTETGQCDPFQGRKIGQVTITYESAWNKVKVDFTKGLSSCQGTSIRYDTVSWYAGPDPLCKVNGGYTAVPGLLPFLQSKIGLLPYESVFPKCMNTRPVVSTTTSKGRAIYLTINAKVCGL